MLLNFDAGEYSSELLGHKKIESVHPKGNQSWIFIGKTVPKLKLQYFGYLMWRASSLKKTLMLGKIEGKQRRGQQMMQCLDNITDSVDMNLSKIQETVRDRKAWCAAVLEVAQNWTWLSYTNRFLSLQKHRLLINKMGTAISVPYLTQAGKD